MLRFGYISETDSARGLARVQLDEDNITTALLPVLVPAARLDKHLAMPAINDQVAVILDENAEQGAILGAMYSAKVNPDGFSETISGVIRSDGSAITHDKATGVTTIESVTRLALKTQVESLADVLSDLISQMQLETHTAPSGPTSPPINAPAYEAIRLRLLNIIE